METKELTVQHKGAEFFLKVVDGAMVSLTDLWRSGGMPKNQAPKDWARSAEAVKFIESLSEKLKVEISHLLRIERDRFGGTYAHWQIATAYAKYLSPELHILVNNIFREHLQETVNPELGLSRSKKRAVKSWEAMGHDEAWIMRRLKGIDRSNEFTAILGAHGVRDSGYGTCTNAIYLPILHGTASEVKEKRSLPAKVNLRDTLDERELASIEFAETLAKLNVKEKATFGTEACAKEANKAGMAVSFALQYAKS